MGNINNIWYLKDSGDDWANSKCAIDKCYSIPYVVGDELYLQVDVPNGYDLNEVWIATLEGYRVKEQLAISEYRKIIGEESTRIIFKVAEDSGACSPYDTGQTSTICTFDIYAATPSPYITGLLDNYLAGLQNTHVQFYIGGVLYDIDGVLPSGYSKISPLVLQVPCDYPIPIPGGANAVQILSNVGNGAIGSSIELDTINTPITATLNCFRFEIPLVAEGEEEGVILSEPFYCPVCESTLIISSDYCQSPIDIFGEFAFNTNVFQGTKSGGLIKAKNNIRIQAAVKRLPSQSKASRNIRCNTFRSSIVERYAIQGWGTDFPDYMMHIIESVFNGKYVYIDGEQYNPVGDTYFSERSTNGYSMKRLEVELSKCEKAIVYDCSCVVDCTVNPIVPGGMVIFNASSFDDSTYGVDNSYIYAAVDLGGTTGGTPPYTVSDWLGNSGNIMPATGGAPFDFDDSRAYNIFRRKSDHFPNDTDTTITVKITDVNGCVVTKGLTVVTDNLTCVGYDGYFEASAISPTQIKVSNILPIGWMTYDISLDDVFTGYQILGVATDPYTITGLTSGQTYKIRLRLHCNMDSTITGTIGPITITMP